MWVRSFIHFSRLINFTLPNHVITCIRDSIENKCVYSNVGIELMETMKLTKIILKIW